MKKTFIVPLVVLLLLVTSGLMVAVYSVKHLTIDDPEHPFSWQGTAFLSTEAYCNITGANNWVKEAPVIMSDPDNPGSVQLRVLDGNSAVIGSEKTLAPGKSVRLDTIPALSGTYVIQGKVTESGEYGFIVPHEHKEKLYKMYQFVFE